MEGLESLSVDWFSPVLVLTLFAPWPDDTLCELEAALRQRVAACEAILLQRRYVSPARFELRSGTLPDPFVARRGELQFALNTAQQNIGYFLDIEPARVWLEQYAQGARVLNLFAYTCTFSVVAKAAGARSVLNMDLSSRSLQTGRQNHHLSQLDTEEVHFFANDILKSWSRLRRKGPYDVLVVDPPSFQKGSFVATKDYPKVLRRLASLAAPDAKYLLCLNAPECTRDEFLEMIHASAPELQFERWLPAHSDFPDVEPQRALKLAVLSSS